MNLRDEASADTAGGCPLTELPSTLLYEVPKKLDVSSQRSLFLASLQLYKTWHLQVSGEDHEWQFLIWSLDVLSQISPQSGCDKRVDIEAYFSDIDHRAIIFCPDQQHNKFEATLTSGNRDPNPFLDVLFIPTYLNQGLLTKEQVLKRCVSSPGLARSSIAFISKVAASQQELKALALHLFSLLHQQEGFVVVRFARHANLLVTHLQDGWKINLKPCFVSPPVIDLTACTEEESDLVAVWGKLYSRGSPAGSSLSDINSISWVLTEHKTHS